MRCALLWLRGVAKGFLALERPGLKVRESLELAGHRWEEREGESKSERARARERERERLVSLSL